MLPKGYKNTRKLKTFVRTSGECTTVIIVYWIYSICQSRHVKDGVSCLERILARCVDILRQSDFPLKGRSELFEPDGETICNDLQFVDSWIYLYTMNWKQINNNRDYRIQMEVII